MQRIGQILSESVPLSDHDIEEILNEQKATRQRFGDAALALGKVRPEQVWDAWLAQLRVGPIDLDRFAPDPIAVAAVPAGLATHHRFVPMRLRGFDMVVATTNGLPASAVSHIERRCGLRLIVARAATETSIDRLLSRIYPIPIAPAA